jgi:hypothetical protein
MSGSKQAELQPVFIVGAARSGTSLLYRTMALHPDATWFSNWVFRFPLLPQLSALNAVSRRLEDRRSAVWFGSSGDNAYVYGAKRPLRDRAFPQPVEAESVYRRAGVPELGQRGVTEVPAEAVSRLRDAFVTASAWDRRRVHVAKRIANNRRIPLLLEAFPQARFLEIVRDGRAVAASLAKVNWWAESEVWWYGGNPATWRQDGRDEWELCARNWVEEVGAVRAGLADVPADQQLSVSYESLVGDPQATMRRVLEFSGLDPDESRFTRGFARVGFPNKNERWRTELDADALGKVERIQGDELRRYGYAVSR